MSRRYMLRWAIAVLLFSSVIFVGCGGSGGSETAVTYFPLVAGNHWRYNVRNYYVPTQAYTTDVLDVTVGPSVMLPNGRANPVRFNFVSDSGMGYAWNLHWEGDELHKLGETYPGNDYQYLPPPIILRQDPDLTFIWTNAYTVVDSLGTTPFTDSLTCEVNGMESVVTDMGTFETAVKLKSYQTTGGSYAYRITWYASGVGMVKMDEYTIAGLSGDYALSTSYSLASCDLQN